MKQRIAGVLLVLAGGVVGFLLGRVSAPPSDGGAAKRPPPATNLPAAPRGSGPTLRGPDRDVALEAAQVEIAALERRLGEMKQENARLLAELPAPAKEPSIEELLDTQAIEVAALDTARTYELALEERDLPPSAVDGIRRNSAAAVPPEITVPPETRAAIDRLIALRIGMEVVSALKGVELAKDPAMQAKSEALSLATGRARAPLLNRVQQLVYHYGKQQGFTVEQIDEFVGRAAKVPR